MSDLLPAPNSIRLERFERLEGVRKFVLLPKEMQYPWQRFLWAKVVPEIPAGCGSRCDPSRRQAKSSQMTDLSQLFVNPCGSM